MSEELQVQPQQTNLPAPVTAQSMISLIAQIASDPSTDVDKVERLLNVQITMMDRQAKMEFDEALARVQASMPRIVRTGHIKTRDGVITSKYMKYEDIDLVIRPLLQAESFSLIHDRREENGKMIITSTLKHNKGHQESVSIPLPYDAPNALKNAVQAAVSTFSYGKRINVCSLLNIVAEGDDDDGVSQGHVKIDDVQAKEIKDTLRDTNSDVVKFLDFMGVDCVENIPMKDYGKAYYTLKRKIRTGKAAG